MRIISKLYIALVIFFLYAPLAVMVVFSFNSSNSTAVFEDFSFRWYSELLKNSAVLNALGNTLLLAFLSALIATVLGSAAAIGVFSYRKKWKKNIFIRMYSDFGICYLDSIDTNGGCTGSWTKGNRYWFCNF